jgi:hypothetical protein
VQQLVLIAVLVSLILASWILRSPIASLINGNDVLLGKYGRYNLLDSTSRMYYVNNLSDSIYASSADCMYVF